MIEEWRFTIGIFNSLILVHLAFIGSNAFAKAGSVISGCWDCNTSSKISLVRQMPHKNIGRTPHQGIDLLDVSTSG